jgi:4-hydroxy-tetrahydrodipicolinate reductase
MSDVRLIVAGAGGRMGRALVKAISETEGATLVGAVESPRSPFIGQDSGTLAGLGENGIRIAADVKARGSKADAIIDFTSPAATVVLAALAAQAGIAHVIGTTGLSPDDEAQLSEAAKTAVIVKSGNMSLCVNLMAALVKRVARTLDESFDIEILEMHHNKKVDAPSGTALLLGRAAADGRDVALSSRSVRARDGETGPRKAGDIGFAALRGGTVIGDHSVIFAGPGERLELSHKAEDRMIFARGALRAAMWAKGKQPGIYSMLDVLGIGDI